MFDALHWHTLPKSLQAKQQLDELRTDALRLFLHLTTVGYLLWHVAFTWGVLHDGVLTQAYAIFALAIPTLVGTHLLLDRSRQAATVVFLGGGLVTVFWATYVLNDARAAMLCAMLVLIASFVVHPLGGLLVASLSSVTLLLIDTIRPGIFTAVDFWFVAVFACLAIGGVWALTHHLFRALKWYEDSYATAEHKTREAREHRAQLVDAWRQLDTAYYRLERANAALEIAWKAAGEAERSKMMLVTNISHELRTPLNLIVGYSEMIMTSPGSYGGTALPPPYRVDLNAIYRSAQHLLALTDDVLDLARLEVGHLGLVREPVDFPHVVRDAVAMVREYVEAKGLYLRLGISDTLPPLILDHLRIRQVLLNLLTNAARWTDSGGIDVQVIDCDDHVRVTVADSGPGIGPEEQSRIFQRFETATGKATDGRTGTGLGLPISQAFVELHGGKMGVDSVLGVGTSFWFTLPLESTGGFATSASSGGMIPGYLRQHDRVLVLVSDDPSVVGVFRRHLQGFRVETTTTLVAAEARAAELKATAIVADIDLHGEPSESQVPLLRCPLPHGDRFLENLGISDYLVKPVTREGVLRAIQGVGTVVNSILIVDDDAWFTQLLSRMLSTGGTSYTIACAHTGDEALAKMRQSPPDLVLLDLAMPSVDGAATLKEMASDPRLRVTKVIIISASDETEQMASLGQDIRLTKPQGFRLVELARLIVSVADQLAPVQVYPDLPKQAPREGQTV